MTITTTYKTNLNGTGKITAKGGGKQRTINYDHSRSIHQNHGDAAGVLALALGLGPDAAKTATHMGFNNGVHKFNVVL
jgi:hypothetical protein